MLLPVCAIVVWIWATQRAILWQIGVCNSLVMFILEVLFQSVVQNVGVGDYLGNEEIVMEIVRKCLGKEFPFNR